ncbi:hypothetical protein [Lunatimonas salinarum]|uniref:hypothetical protein n=1 Tax=Lunatimonas salinarum TaxID=1774590 RepID=UPI001AE03625|nr:hypothetical protein [Lunatimonas salinarum]
MPKAGGFTGPGSGNHWSDGIGNSDWSMWGGSQMYKDGLASGAIEYGGKFYNIDGDGKRGDPYEERNGMLGYWVDSPMDIRDYVLMNNKLFKTTTPGVMSTFYSVGGQNWGMQHASILSGDYTLKDIVNYGMAGAGYVLGGTEAHLRGVKASYAAKGTKTAQRFIIKVMNPSIEKIARTSKGLGVAGVLLNGTITGVNWYNGQDVTASQVADFAIGVGLITAGGLAIMSAPVALVAVGTYGVLDAVGLFDGIKESLGGNKVVFGGYRPGN